MITNQGTVIWLECSVWLSPLQACWMESGSTSCSGRRSCLYSLPCTVWGWWYPDTARKGYNLRTRSGSRQAVLWSPCFPRHGTHACSDCQSGCFEDQLSAAQENTTSCQRLRRCLRLCSYSSLVFVVSSNMGSCDSQSRFAICLSLPDLALTSRTLAHVSVCCQLRTILASS